MNARKVLGGVGIFGIALVVVLGFKYYNKGKASDEVRAQAVEIVQALPGYSSDSKYYDTLFEYAHPDAFDTSYKMGGRRQAAKFDVDGYIRTLLGKMAFKAQQDGREEVFQDLTAAVKKLPPPK